MSKFGESKRGTLNTILFLNSPYLMTTSIIITTTKTKIETRLSRRNLELQKVKACPPQILRLDGTGTESRRRRLHRHPKVCPEAGSRWRIRAKAGSLRGKCMKCVFKTLEGLFRFIPSTEIDSFLSQVAAVTACFRRPLLAQNWECLPSNPPGENRL